MNQTYMKEKKIFPLVMSMALPMMLSMAFNSLYNIVDSYFVAKLSEDAMTALSLVYPAQNLLTAVAVGFGVGVNAMISFYLGAQNQGKADKTATQGMVLGVLHGVLLMVLFLCGMNLFLGMFTKSDTVRALGMEYSNVVFLFSTIVTGGNHDLEKIVSGGGPDACHHGQYDRRICDEYCVGSVVDLRYRTVSPDGDRRSGFGYRNRSGDHVISIYHLLRVGSVAGKIAQNLSATGRRDLWQDLRHRHSGYVEYGTAVSVDFRTERYSGGLFGCVCAGTGRLLQAADLYLSALQWHHQGIRPLIGYNYGAGERKRVEQIYRLTLELTAGIMAIGTALCWLIPGGLIGLFTENPETVTIGITALHIISLGFILSAVSVTSSGALEALGQGLASLVISVMRYVAVIIPAAFVLSRLIGVTGVWWAFVCTESVTAVVAYVLYHRVWKRA